MAQGSWNHALWKTNTHLSHMINTIAADDLATQGAAVVGT